MTVSIDDGLNCPDKLPPHRCVSSLCKHDKTIIDHHKKNEHDKTIIDHHKKNEGVKSHLNKCDDFRQVMMGINIEDRPDWFNIRKRKICSVPL